MSMLTSFPVSLTVATVLGFLAGLGVGGGSLLVLWLTLIVGLDSGHSRVINLLFFLPGALIATFFRRKAFPLKKLLPAMIAGCVTAAGFTLLSRVLPLSLLRRLFGILLIITGLRELAWRNKPVQRF